MSSGKDRKDREDREDAVSGNREPASTVRDPIAIVGIGCRYPSASGPDELWRNLLAGEEAVGSYREERFPELDLLYEEAGRRQGGARTDRGGFLQGIDRFDAQFFEISPRESVYIDPQHRLLLEVAWEALEDAGQVRENYQGSTTGVYTGLWTNEYETRLYESGTPRDFYSVTGCGRASASGRLSFTFGFEGPSVTVDSACSSSLVAVHMACHALWAGEIDMALAGGANLILGPEITELFTAAKMLSPDGRCKFGDAFADGFVRSEGAGIVVLKKLSRALADRDRIYAAIRGGAVNNDGRSSGLLVTPSRQGQKQMVQSAWRDAGIAPGCIRYMEMHGTGTSVGDPVEIEAVGAALAEAGVTRSCALGSIKTNIGHTESAAGVAGLIKAALALHFRTVPPSLHFATPNPKIAWDKFPVHIAAKAFPLAEEDDGPLLAGVSSFGITGTNAHLVLEAVDTPTSKRSRSEGPYLLPVSARSPEALQAQLLNHREWLAAPGAEAAIMDICYTASARREHMEHRAAIVGEDLEDLRANLSAAIDRQDSSSVAFGRAGAATGKVVFVAPGQGSQWLGMARELYATNEVFRHSFQQCDVAIAAETGWGLIDRILGVDAEQYLNRIDVVQPSLFAMSVALASVWRAWGVESDAVVGHSMGEVAAAHIAGILGLADAVAVICRRSRLMKSVHGAGSMATVELSLVEMEELLRGRDDVSIAASNGPRTTVISGETAAVEALLRQLEQKEIYCRTIKVDVASHSAQVDPVLDGLFVALAGIAPQSAKVPMYSTVTGDIVNGCEMDAAYWVRNLRNSVLFAPIVKKLMAEGHDTFIELSPHPILLPAIEATARETNPRALAVASLRRDKPEWATMLRGMATLYAGGRALEWGRFYPEDSRCVPLPRYPFQRERCWPEAPGMAARQGKQGNVAGPLLGRRFESSLQPGTILWETELDLATLPWLGDHRVLGSAVFPASGHVDMALSAAKDLFPGGRFDLCRVALESAAYLPETGSKIFQIALTPEGDTAFRYEIRTSAEPGEDPWPLRSSGLLRRASGEVLPAPLSLPAMRQIYAEHRDFTDHYALAAASGLQYGPAFQLVQEAWVGHGECLCRSSVGTEDAAYSVIHPALLDACFQAMVHVRPETDGFHAGDAYMPVAIERVRMVCAVPAEGDVFVHAVLTGADAKRGTFQTEIQVVNAAGEALVEISGMRLQRVARESSAQRAAEALYTIEWIEDTGAARSRQEAEAATALASKARQGHWIVFADRGGMAEAMQASLGYLGGRCTMVRPGTAWKRIRDAEFTVRPGEPADLARVFDAVARGSGVPTAIVHLWSLDEAEIVQDAPETLMQAQAVRAQHVPMVVQAVGTAAWEVPPRLWLVTAGAMVPATGAEDGGAGSPRVENAPMWGLGRAVAREHAELRPTLVDFSAAPRLEEARALAFLVCMGGVEDGTALRGNKRYLQRMARLAADMPLPAPLENGKDCRIEISSPGTFDNIELRAWQRNAPGAGEICVEVHTAGLNFSDIMKVMGLYPGLDPDQPIPVGNEAVGVVSAVGRGVTAFRPGDEVIVLTPTMRTVGTMASSVAVPVELAILKPACLTTEEAATIATVYVTAYWSLVEQARLRKGDWVLIHAGAGGVGLAAIEIARWAGANIIATVGSKEKEDYVRSRGVRHVLNSRSLEFAQGVMDITAGRGVDVVLNSLAGEFLSRSLDVLAPYGRFVEMGKRDIYADRRIGLKVFRNNASFHVVDVAAAVEDRRPYVAGLLRQIMQHIEAGDWRALPVQTFPSGDPAAPFRFMAQARHIGKIAVRMGRDVSVLPIKDPPLLSAAATYLVPGGLGGVGLTVAEWMAQNGAGHVLLLSRREPSADVQEAIRRMGQRNGAVIEAMKADIANAADVEAVMKTIREGGFPLKGILHAAAVIDDALIANLSPERFYSVMAPKILGTWNLHAATLAEDLDFFVLFSSIAALHPQPGMGSYAAANAFLDSFAQFRRVLGKPAISVNWGGWDQIGLARAEGTGRSIAGYAEQGMRNLSAREALSALETALRRAPVQAIAVPFDWEKFHRFHGQGNVPALFSGLATKADLSKGEARRAEVLDALAASTPGAPRQEIFEAYLQEALGRVLKLAAHKIDRERPLGSMGLDSLMGLEFVRRLSTALEIPVPATVVFNYPSVRLLAAHLLKRMHLDDPVEEEMRVKHKPSSAREETHGESMGGLLADMSEDDALQALIGNGHGGSG